jgi:hypothetical protein
MFVFTHSKLFKTNSIFRALNIKKCPITCDVAVVSARNSSVQKKSSISSSSEAALKESIPFL